MTVILTRMSHPFEIAFHTTGELNVRLVADTPDHESVL